MKSYEGFQWPRSGEVEATDWKNTQDCGNGLHGWLWGVGDFSMKIGSHDRNWLVVEVKESDIVQLDGKVKFPKGNVIFCGGWAEAFSIVASVTE